MKRIIWIIISSVMMFTTPFIYAKEAEIVTPATFGVWDVAYKVSETDFNIKRSLKKAPINQWAHQNDISRVSTQQVIRENQDVIYSSAVVDVRKGATFSLPQSNYFQIIQILDMQNYTVDVVFPGESISIDPSDLTYGNYVYLNMRTRVLPESEGGLEETHKKQRTAKIEAASAISYESPDIVMPLEKTKEVRMAMIGAVKSGVIKDNSTVMGTPYNTNPLYHIYATAYGWGGLPIDMAGYLDFVNQTKVDGDESMPSSITFTPPKVNKEKGGFWSVTTYSDEGWLVENKAAISDSEAVANADGSYTIYFNTPDQKNNLTAPANFAALLRVYLPLEKESMVKFLQEKTGKLVIK